MKPTSTRDAHDGLRVVARLLRCASLGGALFACESGDDAVLVQEGRGSALPTCHADQWAPLSGFRTEEAWSYVSVRTADRLLEERGQVCADASDPNACAAAFARASDTPDSGALAIVATGRERAERFVARDALAFFGPIDSGDEALWMALSGSADAAPCGASPTSHVSSQGTDYRVDVRQSPPLCTTSSVVTYTSSLSWLVREDGGVEALPDASVRMPSGCPVPGRRPPGLLETSRYTADDLGMLFAHEAEAEAASIVAFGVLVRELTALGAPRRLCLAARRAQLDEVRHARVMTRLARRHGCTVRAPRITRLPMRTLEQLAHDNAVEGCVRELYCALRAAYQARNAHDPVVRAAMTGIARDELRHASWSYSLAHWSEARLDGHALRRVRDARRAALEDLLQHAFLPARAEVQRMAGLPGYPETRVLVESLTRELTQLLR